MRRPPPPFLDRTWIPLPTERAVILGFDVTPPSGTVVMVVKQEVFHVSFLFLSSSSSGLGPGCVKTWSML